MTWSRGFFRLWIVATIIWLGLAWMFESNWLSNNARYYREYGIPGAPSVDRSEIIFIIAVPLVVLMLGLVVRWVLVGFHQPVR
ncbi:hypothetical protein ACH79_06455 [Bradyrhizobium sp. CCBAU 051011]|uniref:hypothetical protein n=1 Tax=Bradyrhizobium sp. CCBAU 051011 TaxID=858422 RepID=UPI001373F5F8|nr:hypothetical protein [Bradyrhizobium sp. CCBAU 051011]QHO72320.1 hypothetical protein ACH79_06455 [Bradyrhizobium sp. CCBAU 051011]